MKIKELVNCLVNGIPKSENFSEYVREVAINMHYLSPRAYNYFRKTFNNNFPHESTIRRWYANSDLNAEPGITSKSLEFLKKKAIEKKLLKKEMVVAVSFDEMSIRKQIIWSRHKGIMDGYVTYGCDDKDDPFIAKESIVFMVSGLNAKFRIPVAYHFVNSLDALKKRIW